MNKLFSIFLLIAFLAAVSCLKYELEVAMGEQDFKSQMANLSVTLVNKRRSVKFEWKEKNVIKPNSNHSNKVDYIYQIGQIKQVKFGWNLNKLPNADSPHVYLKHVRIIPTYYPSETQRKLFAKKFCLKDSNQKLTHDYYAILELCN